MAGPGTAGGRLVVTVRADGRVEIQAFLHGVLFVEGGAWVSYCSALDLSTCGATEDEAIERTSEAVRLFLEECARRGTLEKVLSDLNWVRKEEMHLDGLLKPRCVGLRSGVPPAFVVDRIRRDGRAWSGTASMVC